MTSFFKAIFDTLINLLINLEFFVKQIIFNEESDEQRFRKILIPYCVAKLTASFSPDKRLQVGSVLFKNGKIYNSSFNAKPLKSSHYTTCVDEKTNSSCRELIHSEVRTIINCPVSIRKNKLSLLITNAPCLKCASVIADSGVEEVWYNGEHDGNEGITFLKGKVKLHDYTDSIIHLDDYYNTQFSSLISNNPSKFINLFKLKILSKIP